MKRRLYLQRSHKVIQMQQKYNHRLPLKVYHLFHRNLKLLFYSFNGAATKFYATLRLRHFGPPGPLRNPLQLITSP